MKINKTLLTNIPITYSVVLKKMCDLVNIDYLQFDFNKKDWYLKNSWSEEKQKYFKKWLIRTLRNNKVLRDEMIDLSYDAKDKETLEKIATGFIFSYGGTIKN